MNEKKTILLAADIGGTYIKTAVATIAAKSNTSQSPISMEPPISIELSEFARIPTAPDETPASLMEKLGKYANGLHPAASMDTFFSGLALAMPGFPDDLEKKVIGGSPNLPRMTEGAFTTDLVFRHMKQPGATHFGVHLVNDVTAQGFAELHERAVRHIESPVSAVLIALGTGIGGALIENCRVFSGANGWAGEIGHIPVVVHDKEGRLLSRSCACGKLNCAETFGSVSALMKPFSPDFKTAEEILAFYFEHCCEPGGTKQNETKVEVELKSKVELWLEALASLSGALINVFNPSELIFSGAVLAEARLVPLIAQKAARHAFPLLNEKTKFSRALSVSHAGILGAVLHWLDRESHREASP